MICFDELISLIPTVNAEGPSNSHTYISISIHCNNKMNKTIYTLLFSITVLTGAVTISDVHAQTDTEIDVDVNDAAEISSVLAAIQESLNNLSVGVEDITATLLLLSDNVNTADARITSLESKINSLTATGGSASTLLSITTSIDDINAQIADLRSQLGLFRGTVYAGPLQGSSMSDSTSDPPILGQTRGMIQITYQSR